MSNTPKSRSRTPSRAGTPAPRLQLPPLRPTQSFSNFQVYRTPSISSSSSSSSTRTGAKGKERERNATNPAPSMVPSSASSALNVEINSNAGEGILIQDVPEADVETVDGEARGRIEGPVVDEESKLALRQHLRQTLRSREPSFVNEERPRLQKKSTQDSLTLDVEEVSRRISQVDLFPPRQYFVLTEAGKPVFVSGTDDSPELTATMGIMQALISIFADDNDKLRCINCGKLRITFLLRPPLYYVCASSWGEPESITRSHLEYLHLQILSVVSLAQLRRIFERRNNFDLRRLLDGAENLLHSLLARVDEDFAMTMSALHVLKVDDRLRKRAGESLQPPSKLKRDILYIIVIANGRVVTVARPKKHSIHPSDLHILLNTLHSPSILNSSASASWLPVCLPKFNPSGFANVYVSFFPDSIEQAQSPETPKAPNPPPISRHASSRDGSGVTSAPQATKPPLPSPAGSASPAPQSIGPTLSSSNSAPSEPEPTGRQGGEDRRQRGDFETGTGVALVCVSAGGDFEAIRGWCDLIAKKLTDDNVVAGISKSIQTGTVRYSVAELSIPGLRHFVYKSRLHVQVTVPMYEDPYDVVENRRRLVTLYQAVHDNIHAKSGQKGQLKLQYLLTEKESIMGWITQPFELYIAMSPLVPKSAVINAANAVARWVKREEGKLFLRNAPVF